MVTESSNSYLTVEAIGERLIQLIDSEDDYKTGGGGGRDVLRTLDL
jgi:hypothetical protein